MKNLKFMEILYIRIGYIVSNQDIENSILLSSESQETVIIDDFYGWMPFDTLLRLTDRYPMLVDIKGGAVQFTAKRIIITSNEVPDNWYPNVSCLPHRWNALLRRITSNCHNGVMSTLRLKAEGGAGSG